MNGECGQVVGDWYGFCSRSLSILHPRLYFIPRCSPGRATDDRWWRWLWRLSLMDRGARRLLCIDLVACWTLTERQRGGSEAPHGAPSLQGCSLGGLVSKIHLVVMAETSAKASSDNHVVWRLDRRPLVSEGWRSWKATLPD